MEGNGSPALYYKTFDIMDNVTSVVIPVNEEYMEIKNNIKSQNNIEIESESQEIKKMYDELHIIETVEGSGKGKYIFRQ